MGGCKWFIKGVVASHGLYEMVMLEANIFEKKVKLVMYRIIMESAATNVPSWII